MSTPQTVNELILALDKCISKRDHGYAVIDRDFVNTEGKILSPQYAEYKFRKEQVTNRFIKEARHILDELDSLCKRVRKRQPALGNLASGNINTTHHIPNFLSLGKIRVEYGKQNILLPNLIEFPFANSLYITDENQIEILQKLLLRMLYAMPLGRLQLYVFDPNGFGKNVQMFNTLFPDERVFPAKKVLRNGQELKEELKKAMEYAENLLQNVFVGDCMSWTEYNQKMCAQGELSKLLPYKIFTFIDVPDDMDNETFSMFHKLVGLGKDCGFLVLYSFNDVILKAEDYKAKAIALELQKCLRVSRKLQEIEAIPTSILATEHLKLSYEGEIMPDRMTITQQVALYKDAMEKTADAGRKFEDVVTPSLFYEGSSKAGLAVPIGQNAASGSTLELKIGDDPPHYLIGGATGSGKSNLLHMLIMSAANKYSPEELQIYLLDFKDGVEFNIYADPLLLPHGRLIAVEADTEYGLSVLDHLVQEKEERYRVFKAAGCKDIRAYREQNGAQIMPRILVIIDEFQVLFDHQSKDMTIQTMEMLAKQGRGCGIHMILATQSLKSLTDFGTIKGQFGGRIALKCSPEDSRSLLGGEHSNNDAASHITIPYGVLNTCQGALSGNVTFAIPYAASKDIHKSLMTMYKRVRNGGRIDTCKVFSGQKRPAFPCLESFEHEGILTLNLGVTMSFEGLPFRIKLENKENHNLLIGGGDENIKHGLRKALFLSVEANPQVERIFLVGEINAPMLSKEVFTFSTLMEFRDWLLKNDYDNSVVFIGGSNFERELKFPSYGVSPEAKEVMDYFANCHKHNSHCIAFYDRLFQAKSSKLPMDKFEHKIGFHLNDSEKAIFHSNPLDLGKKPMKPNRAVYSKEGFLEGWFLPYSE